MKKILSFITICFLLFTICYLWFRWAISPACQKDCQAKIFVVEKGESFGSVSQRLEQEKLIRSSVAFQILASKEGITRKIQAGDFRLNPKMAPLEIARELTHGTLDRWVTIIEGWRREQIAEKLSESGLEKFNQEEFLEESKNLEGKLFPDTYLIPKDADAKKIVEIFTKNFQKKTPLPSREVLISASIVEREARNKDDRPIIAGILLKRLAKDWPLQADATIQYAVATKQFSNLAIEQLSNFDWWSKSLTREDLKIKSSYNTYLYPGLPPGPISNPGLAAIEAVLNPVETDFWFYLSDSQGKMHYAKTSEEHQENISKYLLK
ncbi:endolytic transglycosylase MltG [Candidatus Shapirobacteria bacterium CG10_big_fil_rev_8_21_14_0_10_40_9]|uniref:Endolytic murein transglycosylase n=1 Tax=Candidatus Shapirobacteria bacterium CG10_big_fil_rev_8_21_14_0_10_40_9 TaxID=1974888 RepID=A0A2M8L4I3_9BACT|nr:MAG: endolytic transglycosylase MltG [Candidatus Shapirobacteria bacterium CG10_big_fil_rev_8_21_14_0_10_40_9]